MAVDQTVQRSAVPYAEASARTGFTAALLNAWARKGWILTAPLPTGGIGILASEVDRLMVGRDAAAAAVVASAITPRVPQDPTVFPDGRKIDRSAIEKALGNIASRNISEDEAAERKRQLILEQARGHSGTSTPKITVTGIKEIL